MVLVRGGGADKKKEKKKKEFDCWQIQLFGKYLPGMDLNGHPVAWGD